MATTNLTELLDREGIRYITIQHSRAYTAQEIAAAAHVSGREMAKTVVTKIDGRPALVVLPAGEKVDFDQIRANTGAHDVELATEQEFATLFPGCELGAMTSRGSTRLRSALPRSPSWDSRRSSSGSLSAWFRHSARGTPAHSMHCAVARGPAERAPRDLANGSSGCRSR